MTWTATSGPDGKSCTVNNCHVAEAIPCQQKSVAKDHFKAISTVHSKKLSVPAHLYIK